MSGIRAIRASRAVRAALAGLTGLLLAGTLVACGDSDPNAAYCDAVRARQQQVGAALGQGDRTGLLAALGDFQAISADAPKDIADDWAVMIRRITTLQQALSDAGVDPATYDPDKPPAGLTAPQRTAIESAAAGLLSPDSVAAFANVQQEVRDVCHTPLSG